MTGLTDLVNLFPLTIGDGAPITYRPVAIRGLPETNDPRALQQLIKQLAYRLKGPVALVSGGDQPVLAVAADAPVVAGEELNLSPWVARLEPLDGVTNIDVCDTSPERGRITRAFLEFALRGHLMRDAARWGSGRRWFSKAPAGRSVGSVLRYPGFVWQLLEVEGSLYVSIDLTSKYVSSQSLSAGYPFAQDVRFRHCLYRFGHSWYEVQLMKILSVSIEQHRFLPAGLARSLDVFSYTRSHCDRSAPWIASLDPASPAIIYRYPGNNVERCGALQLCWLLHRTDDAHVSALHEQSIMTPRERFTQASEIAQTAFAGAQISGRPIQIAPQALRVAHRAFAIPKLRFGNDAVLTTSTPEEIAAYPRRRHAQLHSPRAGPLHRGPFGLQFLILPLSVSRQVNEDFERRLVGAVRRVSQEPRFGMRRITYDDRSARTLHQQLSAINTAFDMAQVHSGYGLLLLPQGAPADLHHWAKTKLQPNVQLKCASADSLLRFYQPDGNIAPSTLSRLNSYVENCAIGVLLVNRRWPWALEDPLHHDVHIGIDVLGGIAGLTYLHRGGRAIFFESRRGAQVERLSSSQLATTLVESLSTQLGTRPPPPKRILVHRDGRLFWSERQGVESAVRRLQKAGLVPLDARIGFVEVHKHTSNNLRLVRGSDPSDAVDATIGSWWALNDREGVVCTTGSPYPLRGTPQPLEVIVSGETTLTDVLDDVFRLSQLGFSAPALSTRLPVVLKLADDFLEAVAASFDQEAADYDVVAETGEGA